MRLTSVKSLFDGLKFTVRPDACTPDQVQALENQLNIKLPNDYKEFLLWMGAGHSGILLADQWLPEDLPELRAKAIQMLADNKFPQKLPDDAFVFWMSQGYVFTFVRLAAGDNSPVFRYHSTLETTDFTPIALNFGDWLSQRIQEHVERMKGFGRPW